MLEGRVAWTVGELDVETSLGGKESPAYTLVSKG